MSQPWFLFSVAVGLAGFGCLQLRSAAWRKLGLLAIWLASGLAAWSLSGSWWFGAGALLAWIVFPAWEMIFVLRRLRLPRQRALESSLPPYDDFPELRELTAEMEAAGLRKVDDCKLMPAPHEQFYRLFVHPTEPISAFIGYVAQGHFGFHFVAFSSEDRSGDQWVTWDYPLSYGLMMPPQVMLYRTMDYEALVDMLTAHREFLKINHIAAHDLLPIPDAAAARQQIERNMSSQLEYNLHVGILSLQDTAPENFRYSWRGTIYVASQVARDLVGW